MNFQLKQHWEKRKRFQVAQMLEEKVLEAMAEEERRNRIDQRRQAVEQQRITHEGTFDIRIFHTSISGLSKFSGIPFPYLVPGLVWSQVGKFEEITAKSCFYFPAKYLILVIN